MGLITRSEASYRLKIVSSLVNNASSACRDGSWKGAVEQAKDALQKLEALLPHIEEAADTDTTCAIFSSDPVIKAERKSNFGGERVGGLGYRGSQKRERVGPTPKPIVVLEAKKPIVTPPSQRVFSMGAAAPPKTVDVAPPPIIPVQALTIETLDFSDGGGSVEYTFDLRKLENYLRGSDPELLQAYVSLSADESKKLRETAARTRQPVRFKVNSTPA